MASPQPPFSHPERRDVGAVSRSRGRGSGRGELGTSAVSGLPASQQQGKEGRRLGRREGMRGLGRKEGEREGGREILEG